VQAKAGFVPNMLVTLAHRPDECRAFGPPLWEMPDAGAGTFDRRALPAPEYEFDQRIAS